MRSVMIETDVEKYGLDGQDTLPLSMGIWQKLSLWFAGSRSTEVLSFVTQDKLPERRAGFTQERRAAIKQKILSRLLEYSKTYRRDSFFYQEGLGYLPQRSVKRHSAFLVYQRRYYQSLSKQGHQNSKFD